MDGIHDLGGLEGFGPVVAPPTEPVFAHDWERRAFGMTFAGFVRGVANGGEWRNTIERMDPVHYLTSRYYEHWFTALLTRLVETGVITHAELGELEARAGGPVPLSRPSPPVDVDATPSPQRFGVGDRVRVLPLRTRGHTRCPGYVRGRAGVVVRTDPPASVPDVEAHSALRCHEVVYSVRFEAAELWDGAEAGVHVHVDLWERYLESLEVS